MTSTKHWAASHGICVEDNVAPVDGYDEPIGRTAGDAAIRAVILHGVAAVGYGVDPLPIIHWFKSLSIWNDVSPNEQALFTADHRTDQQRSDARWRQESQWALLWTIGKIASLGLPTHTCDTARLVDEIMPGLGDPIDAFVASAALRPPGELLAEDDRIYNLHCYARLAFRQNAMPDDLMYDVLFQRHYAFSWLQGNDEWDDVQTDT